MCCPGIYIARLAWLPVLLLLASCGKQQLTTVEFVSFSSSREIPLEMVDISMPIAADADCDQDLIPITFMSRRDIQQKEKNGSTSVVQWLAPKNAQVEMKVKLEKLADTRRTQIPQIELDKRFSTPFTVKADSLIWSVAASEKSALVICFLPNASNQSSIRRLDRVHYAFSVDSVKAIIRLGACEGKNKALVFFDPPIGGNQNEQPDWDDDNPGQDGGADGGAEPDTTGWKDDKPTYCGYSEGDSSIFFVIDNYYCKHAKGENYFRIRWPFVVSNARAAGLDVKGAEDDLFYFITVYRVHNEDEAVRLAHQYAPTMAKADVKQKIRVRDRGKPLIGKLVTSRMYLRYDDGRWEPATARTKCTGTYPSKECTIDQLVEGLKNEQPR